jgi:glycosyltransferase involved in cell wall biosynthesis
MTRPIAYLTGFYPRATDTFIQREVGSLRAQGFEVLTNTVRATDRSHHVGAEQRAEFAATFQVLNTAKNPVKLIGAHLSVLRHNPRGWCEALALAWRTCAPGAKALLWQFFYFLEAAVLAQHLREKNVVHLHVHFADAPCSLGMLTSAMSKIPFSLSIHGPGIFFQPTRWRIDEKIARASFVACISHFCRAQCMLFSDPAHWSKLKIVHCGVPSARYGQDPARAYARRLLFVGRLDVVKGIPLLLNAVEALRAKHPDLILQVVGDGPHRAELERQVQAAGLAEVVLFLGYKSQDEVADILSHSDMLVLPSFAEGVPVVLMEAMAARVPVVTSQVGGVAELVEHGVSGFVYPAGDVQSLTSYIDQIVSHPERSAEMGAAGRAKVVAEFESADEARWLGQLLEASQSGQLPDTVRPTPGDAS